MSKTPKFDEAIGKILNTLEPHERVCANSEHDFAWCWKKFEVLAGDIDFYKTFKVPPPTLCPICRMQRRLAFRSHFVPSFFKKTCSAPGHSEKVISLYSEKNPLKVYDEKFYISDAWDRMEFGREYKMGESFFKQYGDLARDFPHQTLQRDLNSINCEYTASGNSSKNCYYTAVPLESENIYYCYIGYHSKDIVDGRDIDNSEQCYDCVYLDRCYSCRHCIECMDCIDGAFLYDCKNCSNCFMSSNLRNKQYMFRNQQFSKEEYKKKMSEINLGSRAVIEELKKEFSEIMKTSIRRATTLLKVENAVGDMLQNCKNCYWAFRSTDGNNENLRYIWSFDGVKDGMDVYGASNVEHVYESTAIIGASDIKFCIFPRTGLDLEYCIECNNCEHCFGCFGLKDKKYCIFNVQFEQDEYWKLVDQIKTEMLERGEYGEFFPASMGPGPYNDSNSNLFYPLTKEQVLELGWHWEDMEEDDIDLSKFETLRYDQVPDDIKDVGDDILDKALICEKTGKPFRLTKYEMSFYRKHGIPVPTVHPTQRIENLSVYSHRFNLWKSKCVKCNSEIDTIHDPAKDLKVYCEKCYLNEVV